MADTWTKNTTHKIQIKLTYAVTLCFTKYLTKFRKNGGVKASL